MLIKPKYTNEKEAPVKFLKFLSVVLPIGIIFQIMILVGSYQSNPPLVNAFLLFNVVITGVAAIGIHTRKWYGVVVYLCIGILTSIVKLVFPDIYFEEHYSTGTLIGVVIGTLIDLWIFLVYFGKRRLLFDPRPKNYQVSIPRERYQKQEYAAAQFTVDSTTGEVVKEEPIAAPAEKITEQMRMAAPEKDDGAASFYETEKQDEQRRTYGPLDPPDKSSRRSGTILAISAAVLLVVAAGGFLGYRVYSDAQTIQAQDEEIDSLKTENRKKQKTIKSLETQNKELQKDLDAQVDFSYMMWLELQEIGFIVDGSRYYHYFTCNTYANAERYFAHNIRYCESLGYSKCPECWE